METQKKYRLTPRQSEIAVRVSGESQADLFANSAFALFDVMTDVEKVDIRDRMPLEVEGADRDDLLVNWMRELSLSRKRLSAQGIPYPGSKRYDGESRSMR